jgi:NAD(P)-dependent dehydrogenase (short-subunit alcohol dehydrogenase family)
MPMPAPSRTVQKPLRVVSGKVAFITGGSSGIGLGIGRVLSAAGMKVAFTYKSKAHRDAALASFPKNNPGVHAIPLDTTDRDGMVRAADEAERVLGPVDLLCNNAGIGSTAQIETVNWQDWDWLMDVNVNGVFNGIHAFLPRMLQRGSGHIMATSSSGGLIAGSLGVYCTSKFAVVGMMEALRVEMMGRNIGVSLFCPGLVRTFIFDAERNRPASHGVVAAAPAGPPPGVPGAPPVDLMADAMDPMAAGRYVLKGIRRNDLYILSHGEFGSALRERHRLIAASLSKDTVPAGRRLATKSFTPPIYAQELAKRAKPASAKKPATAARRPAKQRRR